MTDMKPRFLFHAEVIPFGARFRRPGRCPAPAAVALPGVGGHARSAIDCFNLGGLVRIDHASSSVMGVKRDDVYETRATCTIEGLRVAGVLEADVLSSVLTSRYVGEHHFYEDLVTIHGLRIGGRHYDIDSGHLETVRAFPTWKHVVSGVEQPRAAKAFAEAGPTNAAGVPIPTKAGEFACYLLKAQPAGGQEASSRGGGHCATVHIGNTVVDIYLAEYLISERQRRLTLLRVEASPQPHPQPGGDKKQEPARFKALALRTGPEAEADEEDPPADPDSAESMSLGESRINGQTHP